MAAIFSNASQCTICLDKLGFITKSLPCRHEFCSRCLTKLINKEAGPTFTCPNCRSVTRKDFETVKFSSSNEDPDHPNTSRTSHSTIDSWGLVQRHILAAEDKYVETEHEIRERCDALVKAAEKCRDDSLERLQKMKIRFTKYKKAFTGQKETVTEKLRQDKEDIDFTSNLCEQQAAQPDDLSFAVPVLRCDVAWMKIQDNIGDFIGRLDIVTVTPEVPEMTKIVAVHREMVTESFSEVYTLFSDSTNDDYNVLTAVYGAEEDKTRMISVSGSGSVICCLEGTKGHGNQQIKRFENGTCLRPISSPDTTSSFSKTTKDTHFRLNSTTHGKGDIRRFQMSSSSPAEVKGKHVFQISCGRHRSFDVSADNKSFVVLEEGQSPRDGCNVRLFTKKRCRPVATYQPPSKNFKPSDLCFYHLGDRQVLLVADEATDRIHVVDVKKDRLVFLRYLALEPGLLFQPAILHVDQSNRLVVANRSGYILLLQPVVSHQTIGDLSASKTTLHAPDYERAAQSVGFYSHAYA